MKINDFEAPRKKENDIDAKANDGMKKIAVLTSYFSWRKHKGKSVVI